MLDEATERDAIIDEAIRLAVDDVLRPTIFDRLRGASAVRVRIGAPQPERCPWDDWKPDRALSHLKPEPPLDLSA